MSNQAKRQYLERIRERYLKASTKHKTAILDEFCAVCGYHRKYAIRLLKRGHKETKRKQGRPKKYGSDLLIHIRDLWFHMEQISAKRMKIALRLWLRFYSAANDGTPCTEEHKRQLRKMSASTLERYLKQVRAKKGLSATRPNYALKNSIPIEILDYKVSKPGAMQADTVVHCGGALAGHYAHTLTMTDVATGWTENRAIWTKEAKQVTAQFAAIESALPFDLHWVSTDCGKEFLNFHVMNYLRERRKPVHLSRGRPYHKDDNAYVEQKNWTHVRQLFGYDRIEAPELIEMMNDIYANYWNPLHNFFFPSFKVIKKEVIGKRIKKTYDQPKTPCQRLLDSEHISNARKRKLRAQYKSLNPFKVKSDLEKKLKEFYRRLRTSQVGPKVA